jgi:hypothetical protein
MVFVGRVALGFPANARLGYGNCGTCHHSPTGGGVLTDYGLSTASEISSFTIFKDKDSKPWPVFAGGDFRFLYTHSEGREAAFPMQADIEVGARYRAFKTVVQLGVYGEEYTLASYRAYMMYVYRKHSLRAGTRNATYNLEYQYSSKSYSLNLTAIGGFRGAIFKQGEDFNFEEPGGVGGSFHAAIFPVSGLLLSLSGALLYDVEKESLQTLGAFSWVIGSEEVYSKFEYSLDLKQDLRLEGQGWTDLMFIPLKGLHTGLTFKTRPDSFSYGSLFVWYPLKGLELQSSLERTISKFSFEVNHVKMFSALFRVSPGPNRSIRLRS